MTSSQNVVRFVGIGAVCVAAGVAGTLAVQRLSGPATHAGAPTSMPSPPATSSMSAGTSGAATGPAPMTVSLSSALAARAGVRAVPVESTSLAASLRVPGYVETNAYKQVAVTPVAGGRVTAVSAELGQTVREGQTLVEIYSPELAEAERAYLSARADLTLADQRRQRTERLGGIGAVSQQELEDVRAEYARQTNAVEGARSRLRLMGLSAEAIGALKTAADIGAVITVPAPSAGVVVKRAVNRGQNVDTAMELITIADLSSVWVIADIYERDMAALRVGAAATITSVALPGESWTGRIAYIDPLIATDTRTLKARIEVANPSRSLKPGMLVDVALGGAASATQVVIPRAAVQQAGERTLVFTPGTNGTFNVREVRLGQISGDRVVITAGLTTSDQVITDGAFSLKAEWERIGGRLPDAPIANGAPAQVQVQRLTLKITEDGFEPTSLKVVAGVPIELVVTRVTDNTCGTEIVVGTKGPRADLPLNVPVTLRIPAMTKGELQIACGMSMLKGVVVAR